MKWSRLLKGTERTDPILSHNVLCDGCDDLVPARLMYAIVGAERMTSPKCAACVAMCTWRGILRKSDMQHRAEGLGVFDAAPCADAASYWSNTPLSFLRLATGSTGQWLGTGIELWQPSSASAWIKFRSTP